MPAPTYVLIADRSSLVMRPPYIRSRLTLLNPRRPTSVKTETPKIRTSNTEEHETKPFSAPQRFGATNAEGEKTDSSTERRLKLLRVPARSLLYVDHSHSPCLRQLPSCVAVYPRD